MIDGPSAPVPGRLSCGSSSSGAGLGLDSTKKAPSAAAMRRNSTVRVAERNKKRTLLKRIMYRVAVVVSFLYFLFAIFTLAPFIERFIKTTFNLGPTVQNVTGDEIYIPKYLEAQQNSIIEAELPVKSRTVKDTSVPRKKRSIHAARCMINSDTPWCRKLLGNMLTLQDDIQNDIKSFERSKVRSQAKRDAGNEDGKPKLTNGPLIKRTIRDGSKAKGNNTAELTKNDGSLDPAKFLSSVPNCYFTTFDKLPPAIGKNQSALQNYGSTQSSGNHSHASVMICVYDPNNHAQAGSPRSSDEGSNMKKHYNDNHLSIHFKNAQMLANKTYGQHKFEARSNDRECDDDEKQCFSDGECYSSDAWCDGKVDCQDGSDEAHCPCRTRLEKVRICDGFYDCPLGEDEMGCFNCDRLSFSCNEWSRRKHNSACFTLDQKCDGVAQCSNKKDESECSMLHDHLDHHSTFAISQMKGFLHKNYKGKWYPVCGNPYKWAAEACLLEDPNPKNIPFVQLIQKPNDFEGKFLQEHDDSMAFVPSCFNNSAIYVSCKSPKCGLRSESADIARAADEQIEDDLLTVRTKRQLGIEYEPVLGIGTLHENQYNHQYLVQFDNILYGQHGDIHNLNLHPEINYADQPNHQDASYHYQTQDYADDNVEYRYKKFPTSYHQMARSSDRMEDHQQYILPNQFEYFHPAPEQEYMGQNYYVPGPDYMGQNYYVPSPDNMGQNYYVPGPEYREQNYYTPGPEHVEQNFYIPEVFHEIPEFASYPTYETSYRDVPMFPMRNFQDLNEFTQTSSFIPPGELRIQPHEFRPEQPFPGSSFHGPYQAKHEQLHETFPQKSTKQIESSFVTPTRYTSILNFTTQRNIFSSSETTTSKPLPKSTASTTTTSTTTAKTTTTTSPHYNTKSPFIKPQSEKTLTTKPPEKNFDFTESPLVHDVKEKINDTDVPSAKSHENNKASLNDTLIKTSKGTSNTKTVKDENEDNNHDDTHPSFRQIDRDENNQKSKWNVESDIPAILEGMESDEIISAPLNEEDTPKGKAKDVVATKKTEARVVGGTTCLPAAWPWIVAINRNGLFHCGGVILSDSWILSASHCVDKYWKYYFEVQAGILRRLSFSPQEQTRGVAQIVNHPLYNKTAMSNDICLMKLSQPLAINRWVRPICLPSETTAGTNWLWGPHPGTKCTAIGWGAMFESGGNPDHLHEVQVPILAHCKHTEDRTGQEICAGYKHGGKDACQGDSGGPLVCRNPMKPKQWYIAGVVSHGEGCARAGEPGVYTRVSIFRDWIHDTMVDEHYPSREPKQKCPGFECIWGVTRCLPAKRRCDKLVDCLGGEDEVNCHKYEMALVGSTKNDSSSEEDTSDGTFRSAEWSISNSTKNITIDGASSLILETEATEKENLLGEAPKEVQTTTKEFPSFTNVAKNPEIDEVTSMNPNIEFLSENKKLDHASKEVEDSSEKNTSKYTANGTLLDDTIMPNHAELIQEEKLFEESLKEVESSTSSLNNKTKNDDDGVLTMPETEVIHEENISTVTLKANENSTTEYPSLANTTTTTINFETEELIPAANSKEISSDNEDLDNYYGTTDMPLIYDSQSQNRQADETLTDEEQKYNSGNNFDLPSNDSAKPKNELDAQTRENFAQIPEDFPYHIAENGTFNPGQNRQADENLTDEEQKNNSSSSNNTTTINESVVTNSKNFKNNTNQTTFNESVINEEIKNKSTPLSTTQKPLNELDAETKESFDQISDNFPFQQAGNNFDLPSNDSAKPKNESDAESKQFFTKIPEEDFPFDLAVNKFGVQANNTAKPKNELDAETKEGFAQIPDEFPFQEAGNNFDLPSNDSAKPKNESDAESKQFFNKIPEEDFPFDLAVNKFGVQPNNTAKPKNELDAETKQSFAQIPEDFPFHIAENGTFNPTTRKPESKTGFDDLPEEFPFNIAENGTFNPGTPKPKPKTDIEKSDVKHTASKKIKLENSIEEEFHCHTISQKIPISKRCNRVVDCEDSSDEYHCTCLDYVRYTNPTIFCDGYADCEDGTDEASCDFCPPDNFYCKISEDCIPKINTCDGKQDCEYGEDEIDCFALLKDNGYIVDKDSRPHLNLEGILSLKKEGTWQTVCENDWNLKNMATVSNDICSYLGFGVHSYNIERVKKYSDHHTNHTEDNKSDCNALYVKCQINYNYDHNEKYDPSGNGVFKYHHDESSTYMKMQDMDLLSWSGKLYSDGNYKCSGILVAVDWIMIHKICRESINFEFEFVVVVFGSKKSIPIIKSPYEQTRKIDGEKEIQFSTISLLHLDNPIELTRYVKPILINKITKPTESDNCLVTGLDKIGNPISIPFVPSNEDCGVKDGCFIKKDNFKCDMDTIKSFVQLASSMWSGILVCYGSYGWYPAATYHEPEGPCGFGKISKLPLLTSRKEDINIAISSRYMQVITPLPCNGIQCTWGQCLSPMEICDGVKNCNDGYDEYPQWCNTKNDHCLQYKQSNYQQYEIDCTCTKSEMNCFDGSCVSKSYFGNGIKDCPKGEDEPHIMDCRSYLALADPNLICDGHRHCLDKSDEAHCVYVNLNREQHQCYNDHLQIPRDYVCDGHPDCPHEDDESFCQLLTHGHNEGSGIVSIQNHGVLLPKCYNKDTFTKFELEQICSDMGFTSGHARFISITTKPHQPQITFKPMSKININGTDILFRRGYTEFVDVIYIDQPCIMLTLDCE